MSDEMVKSGNNLPAVPDYLKVEGDTSTDGLKQYIRPNRVKVIQSMTDEKLKEAFGVGSVILVPDNVAIREVVRDDKGNPSLGETRPFQFTPIYFFTEFCAWNPLESKGSLPAIRERTVDKNHPIAIKSRDFSRRKETHPDNPDWEIVYCEHLNFIVAIPGVEEPCVMTFSRGEFKTGVNFAGLIKLRRGIPLYANVFDAHIAQHKNKGGNTWFALDIENPETSPYVGEELFAVYKELNAQYSDLYMEEKIEVVYDEGPIDVQVAPSPAAETM